MLMALEKKILVIIPAFNEEGSIGKVVEGVKTHFPQIDALVVNDGSGDLTSEIARSKGAIVLDLPFNLGIGGAMQAGYKYAFEKGYDIAIQVDGDGQHEPSEIPKLLRALEEGDVDVAMGSRFVGDADYKGPVMRRLGSLILSKAISMVVGQKLTDPTSGFRAANRRAIRLFSINYPQDYPEPEAMVLLHQCGLKMKEIPVKINQRYSGESSITKIRSIYYMVKVLLAIFVDCFKKRPALN
jgi:glycosyltransferase involved in cell wall biosynthesis